VARSNDPDTVLLQAAADPTRLAILRRLSVVGPVCACEFTATTDVSQPTVSHHLKVLREAGWISGERRGTWIWYSIRPEAVERFARIGESIAPTVAVSATIAGGRRRLPVLGLEGTPAAS
jgi:DNA-binding transcriptional ArsR family regulator